MEDRNNPISQGLQSNVTAQPVEVSSSQGDVETRPFPRVPLEIRILIFEHAACESKAAAASLALVSKFSRAIVLPFLFHTLIIQQRNRTFELVRFLRGQPDIAVHIRNIWCRRSITEDCVLPLSCPQLERIAISSCCFSALCHLDVRGLGRAFKEFIPWTIEGPAYASPHELLIFPGFVAWHNHGLRGFIALSSRLNRLWLSQTVQLNVLLYHKNAVAVLSHLTHLATPIAGPNAETTVRNVFNAFPDLTMFVIMPRLQYDPGCVTHNLRGSEDVRYTEEQTIKDLHGSYDKRVHVLNASGRFTEDFLFSLWKGQESKIWDPRMYQ
ncbi:uncharacterized protein FOMMEDRAFT_159149 [Fomitiporia mediterranea MF3/22]|uniref:uncharacterized protein n=1 Tax=Fomitiporia mediterranea (strain MF3/22) TaxID=694068 RepID=UPI0004407BEE|nr:uncharacterized protein FOMMEDRAFT_159149 [Fomitiporia mediterranea MF3/22]EJD00457.1 hypothetical protein FOMMEDRAFT_159149 [Fomitiporia mediterranea MF3/22]